jgi:hypothetical protein
VADGRWMRRAYSPRTGSSIHFCECARNEVTAAAEGGVVCKATRLRNALREAQRTVSAVCPVKAEVINIRQRTTCQMQQARHWMERRGLSYQQWQFTATRDEDLAQQVRPSLIHLFVLDILFRVATSPESQPPLTPAHRSRGSATSPNTTAKQTEGYDRVF